VLRIGQRPGQACSDEGEDQEGSISGIAYGILRLVTLEDACFVSDKASTTLRKVQAETDLVMKISSREIESTIRIHSRDCQRRRPG
jgi:hypothetical protein